VADRRYDVAVVGDCGVDLYARVPWLPGHDEKVPGDYLGTFGGGVAANFACAASRLGAHTTLLASVGDDAFAEVAVGSVAEHGVDVGGVARLAGETTSFCFIALDASGEKALTIVRTPTFFPRFEDVDLDRLRTAQVVHLAPFELDVAERLAQVARQAGAVVTVDLEPGMVRDGGIDAVRPLLRQANLVMPNRLCLELLWPDLDTSDAVAELRRLGPEAVVLTRGEAGALVSDANGDVEVPAVPVEVVDTTGAGDCFNAALVTSWAQGGSLRDAARFAAAAASRSLTAVGARGRLPRREEVLATLASAGPEGGAQ
jgi:sugar/nucleoside kinase (ribokinase family)